MQVICQGLAKAQADQAKLEASRLVQYKWRQTSDQIPFCSAVTSLSQSSPTKLNGFASRSTSFEVEKLGTLICSLLPL